MNRSSPGVSRAWRMLVPSCDQLRTVSAARNGSPAGRAPDDQEDGTANSANSDATSRKLAAVLLPPHRS